MEPGYPPLHPASDDRRQVYTAAEFAQAFPSEGHHLEFKEGAGRDLSKTRS